MLIASGNIRSKVRNDGEVPCPKITKQILENLDSVAPKLVKEGMFFIRQDIKGAKMMEVIFFSACGFGHCNKVNNFEPIIKSIDNLQV